MPVDPLRLAGLALPLLAIGFAAGGLRVLARREGPVQRQRALSAGWVLVLLVGTPAWLVLAALLRLW